MTNPDLFPLTVKTSKRAKKALSVDFEIAPERVEPRAAFTFASWRLLPPASLSPSKRAKLSGFSVGFSTFSGAWEVAHDVNGCRSMRDAEIARIPRRLVRDLMRTIADERNRTGDDDLFAKRHPRASYALGAFRDFEAGDRVRVWDASAGERGAFASGEVVETSKCTTTIRFECGLVESYPDALVDLA